MPGRKYTAINGYHRYGFNGQEKEIEINSGTTSAEFWQYDSRVARRWNVDPRPNVSVSPYGCFDGNPIRFNDILGDSIGPDRKIAFKVFIVGKTRDNGSALSFSRFKKAQQKDPSHSILVETDKIDQTIVNEILSRLGKDGYIKTLAIDYHRSVYDKMPVGGKDKFFAELRQGYTGDKTEVFLGMCWSGGGPTFRNIDHPDLTIGISQKLDKATVYGLRTEANNLSFWYNGDFGGFMDPAYAFTNDQVSQNEKKYQSVWTVTNYSTKLKGYVSGSVRMKVTFTIDGTIIKNKYVSDLDNLMKPPKVPYSSN